MNSSRECQRAVGDPGGLSAAAAGAV